jgi:energy-coupling factor transporter transmembrane protein EcfT
MYDARKARTIGAVTHDAGARRFVAASAGALFAKSHHLSEEVHDAMIARGYRGDAKVLSTFTLKFRDYAFAAGLLLAAAVIYEGDRRLGR